MDPKQIHNPKDYNNRTSNNEEENENENKNVGSSPFAGATNAAASANIITPTSTTASSANTNTNTNTNINTNIEANTTINESSEITISENASALIISASDKAGMEGIDRSKIDAIILRESGSSKYMQQQRKQDEKVNVRIQQLKQKIKDATTTTNNSNKNSNSNTCSATTQCFLKPSPELEERMETYKRQQNTGVATTASTCVVVDMDMFYMACELLTRPELHDVPACVGYGIILTSNYKARRYGVRSAMPGFIGDQLVKELSNGTEQLVTVPSHFDLYKHKSKQTMAVLAEYDPFSLKSYSLDEAYLDLAPYLAIYLQLQSINNNERYDRSFLQQKTNNSGGGGGDDIDDGYADRLHEQVKAALATQNNSKRFPIDNNDSDAAATTTTTASNEQSPTKKQSSPSKSLHDAAAAAGITFDYGLYLQFQTSPDTCRRAMMAIVSHMRRHVQKATGGLTCSAGIAPNFMLAKIASDYNKPNGQYMVDPNSEQVLKFVQSLPVRKIPGIGRVTEKVLQKVANITTVQELYEQRGLVAFLFKPATAQFLLRASVGCAGSSSSSSNNNNNNDEDLDALEEGNEGMLDKNKNNNSSSSNKNQKGISRERTFQSESSWAVLNDKLEDIALGLAKDLKQKSLLAHTITVKIKLDTFDVWSRAKTLPRNTYIQKASDLVEIASTIFLQLREEIRKKHAKQRKSDSSGCVAGGGAGHSKSNNNEQKSRTTSSATTIRCRLLGIRCSNLIDQDDHACKDIQQQSSSMERFLSKKTGVSPASAVPSSPCIVGPHTYSGSAAAASPAVNTPSSSPQLIFKPNEILGKTTRTVATTSAFASASGSSKNITNFFSKAKKNNTNLAFQATLPGLDNNSNNNNKGFGSPLGCHDGDHNISSPNKRQTMKRQSEDDLQNDGHAAKQQQQETPAIQKRFTTTRTNAEEKMPPPRSSNIVGGQTTVSDRLAAAAAATTDRGHNHSNDNDVSIDVGVNNNKNGITGYTSSAFSSLSLSSSDAKCSKDINGATIRNFTDPSTLSATTTAPVNGDGYCNDVIVATTPTITAKNGGENQEEKEEWVSCPLCQQKMFHIQDNVGLNRHIDMCLNTTTTTTTMTPPLLPPPRKNATGNASKKEKAAASLSHNVKTSSQKRMMRMSSPSLSSPPAPSSSVSSSALPRSKKILHEQPRKRRRLTDFW